MQSDRIVSGLAVTFGAIAVVLVVLGVVYSPLLLFVALPFAVAAAFVYYQASGRMAARLYQQVQHQAAHGEGGPGGEARRRGGVGAGPREEWTPPRDGATARERAAPGGRRRRTGAQGRRTRGGARDRAAPGRDAGPSPAEAYRTLGVEQGADEETVTAAYREKVKEVHPDRPEGDADAFREVQDAYERLTE